MSQTKRMGGSKDYQRVRNNKYWLPGRTYVITLNIIRDYDNLRERRESILHATPRPNEGMPRSNETSDPTFCTVAKLEKVTEHIRAIEEMLIVVPEEYRKGVFENIVYGAGFPLDADRVTYGRWKSTYIYAVAEKLNFV